MSDAVLYEIECVLLTTLLFGFGLACAHRRLARTRPGFAVGMALTAGVGMRLVAVAGVSASGIGDTLRGVDETTFLHGARQVAASGFDSGLWLPSQAHRLQEIVFAFQLKLGDFPDAALRVTQIAIAMTGILLIIGAIYDLAGARAARTGAWVLALEPASIFFNGILHREPLMVLASGLVVFGGAKIWAKLELRGIALVGLGCTIALATRPYAAWFLITGGLLLILHAALRQVGSAMRSLPLVYAVAIVVAVAMPTVLTLTSRDSLERNLQSAQDANTAANLQRGSEGSNNLSLERVDFSTRSNLLTNLPQRMRDIVLRPYPWQLQNSSQQLGALGTLVVLAALFLLVRYIRRNLGRSLALTAPIVYPALFLLMAYALSVGNAGTGFRYRTHLVLLGLAALVVLREHALARASATGDEEPEMNAERVHSGVGRVQRDPSARSRRGSRPAETVHG